MHSFKKLSSLFRRPLKVAVFKNIDPEALNTKVNLTLKGIMSEQYTLSRADKLKWVGNQLEFLKPFVGFIGVLYLGQVIVTLSLPDHVVTTQDFYPSQAVITATALYVTNALYDLFRKWSSS